MKAFDTPERLRRFPRGADSFAARRLFARCPSGKGDAIFSEIGLYPFADKRK
jgi:hypothetical protein